MITIIYYNTGSSRKMETWEIITPTHKYKNVFTKFDYCKRNLYIYYIFNEESNSWEICTTLEMATDDPTG